MGLSQQQWFDKLKTFYPKEFFQSEASQIAHLNGMAAVFATIQADNEAHQQETFIGSAKNSFLDSHGEERSISRIYAEFDNQYRVRVQHLRNQSNIPDIKALVDLLLMVGQCTIFEDNDAQYFANREVFLNRGAILLDRIKDTFSIIVERQIHDPYSFLGREYFLDREDYLGTSETSDYVMNLILETVNNAKAFGTLYRIYERLEA